MGVLESGAPGLVEGLVVRKQRDRYEVLAGERAMACEVAGALRHRSQGRAADPVAVGDVVRVRPTGASTGVITGWQPRRSQFSRRAAGPKPVEQIIAANIDLVVPVFATAEPKPRWPMLDRYLVAAESAHLPALVCVTKVDLSDRRELDAELRPFTTAGYPIVRTSVRTDEGMDELRARLTGRTSLLLGKSGVGKSSLINLLGEGSALRTGEISTKTGKGRHTTSDVEMVRLPFGGAVIDTPGVREFGLWNVDPVEVASCFPEMRGRIGHCRFGADCTHSHEPGCAIKEAVRRGDVDPRRYRSYLRFIGAPEAGYSPAADDDDGGTVDDDPAAPARPGVPGRAERLYKHAAKNERPARPEASPFCCARCGLLIPADAPGTEHRNHCPQCLWSLHVDQRPGDRAAGCSGAMEPIAVSVRPDGEWTLVHRCRACGVLKNNRIAGDDNGLLLMSLAARPLARPPFPLDRMAAEARMRAEG